MNKIKLILLILCYQLSFGTETISYSKNSIHAFLPKNGEISLGIGMEMMNSTIDVLKIKEQEFGGTGQNIDSLGDMKSLDLEASYAANNHFYLHSDFNKKYLEYSGSTLVNNNVDLYVRYQAYQNDSFAFAIDGGFETNRAEDVHLYDIDVINSNIRKVAPDKDIKISEDGNGSGITYKQEDGSQQTASLSIKPYLALLDTYDESFYYRFVASLKSKNILFDVFAGYKQIKVNYAIDSSLAHETSLQNEIGDKASVTQERQDGMIFSGFGFRYLLGSLSGEVNYKYNKMLRISGLSAIDSNHILDMNLLYGFNDGFVIYLGGKVMSNQFNGEIHYLYTQYSQTSFDHPYGYMNIGTIIRF